MIGDMKQSIGERAEAYQAKRDINITNTGMDYRNVKQLCLDLIHDNFPKLQEEAMKQVNENVRALAIELKQEFTNHNKIVDASKLTQPDVQAALNEAVQGAAKKGKKSDLKLLANLVSSRLGSNNSDLLDITIEEAIRITPKLTKEHINFLSVKHFLSSMTIQMPNVNFQHLESFSAPVKQNFSYGCELSAANFRYLAGVGVLDYNPVFGHDIFDIFQKNYPELANNREELEEKIKVHAPSLACLIDIYNKHNFSASSLNSFGQVIALSSLNRIYGNIDLKIWIN